MIENINNDIFLLSASTEKNPFNTTQEVLTWINKQNQDIKVDVKQIPFSDLKGWSFDADGNLRHVSGKFFSIEGLSVETNYGNVPRWQQPIINQPEIGFLGIITKEINGILYFLLQAKVEPGNINNVQLSPTLQATKSNYTQVHGGNKPAYLEYFQNATPSQILLDQLQSEQGARFYKKRNRNIIIKVEENIPVYENFIWLTLAQIKLLLQYDNIVNMDTRTVISGISMSVKGDRDLQNTWGAELLKVGDSINSVSSILNWMTQLKCHYELSTDLMPLSQVQNWSFTDYVLQHASGKYFEVIAAEVTISNREVKSWMQPLIKPIHPGLTAFIVKKINGIYHFLVQGKVELGNFDVVEMAPTVQCITDSYKGSNTQPFVDYVLHAQADHILIDTMQSEEGGRFYHEQNRNIIIEAGEDLSVDAIPENYIWVTYEQLLFFLRFNNFLNIQARSLISMIGLL
jgi:oxidase EvaA